jgi:hypothetical protein
MAALLENLSQIGPGEQIWIQMLIKPLAVDWGRVEGEKVINKMLKIPPAAAQKGIIGTVAEAGAGLVSEFTTQLIDFSPAGVEGTEKKDDQPFRMMNLTPGQKEQMELIERKIAKLAFNTKVRYLYVAEKDKMNKSVGVNGVIGAIKQWTDMNANGFKPDLKTTGTNAPQYILIDKRRNARRNWLLNGYIKRDGTRGSKAKPLCGEELASFWHFPSMFVKAPMLRKTEFRKAAAPVDLPFGNAPVPAAPKELAEVMAEKTQVVPTFDYDNDTFEMQFAKDKEAFIKSRPVREKKLKEIAKDDIAKLEKAKKEELKDVKEAKKSDKKTTTDRSEGNKKLVEKSLIKKADKEKSGLPDNLPVID